MASALMMRATAGATALAAAPAPRVAAPVLPLPRPSRQVAARAAKLEKPNRLWVRDHWQCCVCVIYLVQLLHHTSMPMQELDTVWYPGAEAAPHLDATLGVCSFDAHQCGRAERKGVWSLQVTAAQ